MSLFLLSIVFIVSIFIVSTEIVCHSFNLLVLLGYFLRK